MKDLRDVKILVVDDEDKLREIIVEDLEEEGYQVYSASGGREAFEIIKAQKMDIVISDIRMPDGDGLELLDKIKNTDVDVPVVLFITGFSDISPDQAYEKGADCLLQKPVKYEVLMNAVRTSLMTSKERWQRGCGRLNVDLSIDLSLPGVEKAVGARTLNIGRGGMFVSVTDDNFPEVGECVEFNINFSDKKYSPLCGRSIVRWKRVNINGSLGCGIGLEFIDLDNSTVDNILNYIRERKVVAFIPQN